MLLQRRKKEGLTREKQDTRHYRQHGVIKDSITFMILFPLFCFFPSPLEQKIEVTDS